MIKNTSHTVLGLRNHIIYKAPKNRLILLLSFPKIGEHLSMYDGASVTRVIFTKIYFDFKVVFM